MPAIQVLTDAQGNVIGTALSGVSSSGTNPPQSATLVAESGQKLSQLTIDDKTAALDAAALHTALKTQIH